LRFGVTLAAAMRLWWRNGRSFTVLALAIVTPLTVGIELLARVTGPVGVKAGVIVAVTSASVLGEVFCAGLADHVVRREQLGLAPQALWGLTREVPFLRLVAAAIVVSAVVLVGLALLVVPGLAAFGWLVMATPLVSLERAGVWSALRGSVAMVRGHYWPVAALTTVTFIPSGVGDWISDEVAAAHAPLWTEVVVEIVTDALAVSVTAAIVVTMFDALTRNTARPTVRP
jgi:hypothetical protein